MSEPESPKNNDDPELKNRLRDREFVWVPSASHPFFYSQAINPFLMPDPPEDDEWMKNLRHPILVEDFVDREKLRNFYGAQDRYLLFADVIGGNFIALQRDSEENPSRNGVCLIFRNNQAKTRGTSPWCLLFSPFSSDEEFEWSDPVKWLRHHIRFVWGLRSLEEAREIVVAWHGAPDPNFDSALAEYARSGPKPRP